MIIAGPKVGAARSSRLLFWRDRIEQELAKSTSEMGSKNKLRDACEYSIRTPGKRLRPLIVLLIAEALGHGLDVMDAAISVEFFHSASLIVDDLPAMDDAQLRRGQPPVHKVFGESIALLASYALITAAFERLQRGCVKMRESGAPYASRSDRVCVLALESTAVCAGILGATSGQFLDMFPGQPTLDGLRELIYKKTVTLFEVCFVLGWLYGGGDFDKLPMVKSAAYHLGFAFQVADDLKDCEMDQRLGRKGNIACFLGKPRATALFQEELQLFQEKLQKLEIATPSFERLVESLLKAGAV